MPDDLASRFDAVMGQGGEDSLSARFDKVAGTTAADPNKPKDFLSRTLQGFNPFPMLKATGSVLLSAVPGETGAAARQTLRDTAVAPLQMARDWQTEAGKGEYQGIFGDMLGMVLPGGLFKGAQSRVMKPLANKMYGEALNIPESVPMNVREEMVKRGIDPNRPLTISEKSAASVWSESQNLKKQVNDITKTDPIYSQRTIPIAPLLADIDAYITDLIKVDPKKAAQMQKYRDIWEQSLGGKAGQKPVTLYGPNGQKIPNPAPQFATVADAQRIKEIFSREMAESSFADTSKNKGRARGMRDTQGEIKTGIENVIPEEPVRQLNQAIQRDIYLKKAINKALKKNPHYFDGWLATFGVLGVEEMAMGRTETGVAAIGAAVVRAALKDPRNLSSLAVKLNQLSESGGATAAAAASPLFSVPGAHKGSQAVLPQDQDQQQ